MPRLPKDYSKGLIYKLCCKDTSIKEIYVGSSTNFTQRKRCHKSCCNNPKTRQSNLKVYQFIRENGNWDNWNMVLIEYFSCETELELGRREDYWKQELQASLNSQSPPIHENKEERSKLWYQANKEKRAEQTKIWYEKNKEQYLKKVKKWSEANKERKAELSKLLYEKNKEQINQKITCECGCVLNKGSKSRHEKTAKHKSILEKRNLLGQGIPEILS